VGGMFRGDRARKDTLVEHGFRLPSAVDNRPLKFEEFEERMPQTIYVSATPGDYELKKTEGEIVQQVVRPTGLMDPVIHVRPVRDQVDRVEVARDWTARLRRTVDHALAVRDTGEYPEALFYDVQFSDFVKDQFGVVQKIYEAFGLPLDQDAEARMRAFIEDHPKGKDGVHHYTPEQFGVDPAEVRREFRNYIERFGLDPD
jgi:hypothetical protein